MGVGVSGFFANFELYRPADLCHGRYIRRIVNTYIYLFIEEGIIGLILWVSPIIVVVCAVLGKTKTTSSSYARKMCVLCVAVIGTLSVHSVWEVHLHQSAISVYFYVFLALGIVSTEINRKSKSARV